MDKPRWLITWILAAFAVTYSFHDSFWWSVIKIAPFAALAQIIEHYRSRTQNGDFQ